MDWISGIQRAIDYTEEHLTEDIDMEEAAKAAASSLFHFQRIFSMLTGFTLGDYIRMRRLSLAAQELCKSRSRIIDTALKYGYDSPESFTRAFTRFHGITPSEVKKGANAKSFSRLSVKLILSGGNLMDYRIERKDSFKLICKRKHVNKPQDETATADISSFWAQCTQDGTVEKLTKYADFENLHGILGICFTDKLENQGFPYGIGAQYNGKVPVEEGFEIVEVPALTYAVFKCRGKMPDAFKETYKKIVTEFFPQSSVYEYASKLELEVYPSADVQNPDYSCEIWIAVNEKKN